MGYRALAQPTHGFSLKARPSAWVPMGLYMFSRDVTIPIRYWGIGIGIGGIGTGWYWYWYWYWY